MIPRTVIDYGFYEEDCVPDPVGHPVYETWVAASPSRRLAVQISSPAPEFDSSGVPDHCVQGPGRIRYALGSIQSNNWRSGYVPVAGLDGILALFDPCVAAIRSDSDDFYVIAMTTSMIWGCRYITPPAPAQPYFTAWDGIDSVGEPLDKIWVVRGGEEELYTACFRRFSPHVVRIGRSVDGGQSWHVQDATAPPIHDPQGAPVSVTSGFCVQPLALDNGPLYLARWRGGLLYDFLVGTDKDGTQGENEGVELDFLRDAQGQAVEMSVNLQAGDEFGSILPWATDFSIQEKRIPWILADPTSADRLYVVYEDTASASGTGAEDLNVYLRAISRTAGAWSIGPRIQVDQDNVPDACGDLPAAYLPAATIDRFGRVHVLFYSNRVADDDCLSYACQPPPADELCCGIGTHGPVYDAWYALSIHDSQTGEITGFANKNLRTSCSQHPALDSRILDAAGYPYTQWYPHEYNGIALDESDADETLILMAYSGLLAEDDDSIDPSAIYASIVKVENPQE